MTTRQIWSYGGLAAITAVTVAAWILFRGGDDHPLAVNEPFLAVESPPGVAQVASSPDLDATVHEPGPSVATAGTVRLVDDLLRLCPDPWSGWDRSCAQALTRRYGSEPVGLAKLHDIPGNWDPSAAPPAFDGVAWQEVFADSLATREAAQASLRRPECRVPPTETRPDLRAVCSADEIAKLAMLHTGCAMTLVLETGFNPWGPPDDVPREDSRAAELDAAWWQYDALDEDVSLPLDEYWRRRAEIDDARLRFAWRLMQCKAVPKGVLAWLQELPTPAAGGHQGRDLTEAAARLGSDWAIRELRQSKQLVEQEWREWRERQSMDGQARKE